MATYGKPTTSFFVNYGLLDPMAAQRALAPVIIAPRYRLHTIAGSDLTSAKLGSLEDLDRSIALAWPGRESGSEDILELNSAVVYANNAEVVIHEGLAFNKGSQDNKLTIVAVPRDGFGIAVGDKLLFGDTVKAEIIAAVQNGNDMDLTVDCDLSAVTVDTVDVISGRPLSGLGRNVVDGVNSVAADGITLGDNLTVDGRKLAYGDIYVEYRELLVAGAFELRTNLHMETVSWAGACDSRNPMGMMYAACGGVSAEAFFYLVSVPSDSEEDYIKAINYVGQFEDCYAPICYKQTVATQAAILAMINKYSNPQIAHFKRSWFCVAEDLNNIIYERNEDDNALEGAIVDGKLELTVGDLYKGKILDGDFAVVATSGKSYEIKDITSKTTATLADASVNEATSRVYFKREYVGAAYAKRLAEIAAGINSERINFVVCDKIEFAGEVVSPVYACAALAALRGALPPHAPMNDLQLPGFTLQNTLGWSDYEYEMMNAGGCWILYRDIEGRTLCYHQITTKTDGTIAEEDSVVSNGDSIVRTLRKSVAYLCGGKGNATQALLDDIRVSLSAAFKQIESEVYPAIYGSRILDWNIGKLYIPEGNKRSVMCECDIECPQPTQDSRFNFNLF